MRPCAGIDVSKANLDAAWAGRTERVSNDAGGWDALAAKFKAAGVDVGRFADGDPAGMTGAWAPRSGRPDQKNTSTKAVTTAPLATVAAARRRRVS